MSDLITDLAEVMNRHSAENSSNTPDFILAEYLVACLNGYNNAIHQRAEWYGRIDAPGKGSIPFPPPSDDVPAPTEET